MSVSIDQCGLLEAAQAYVRRGWSIIPISPGKKFPDIRWKVYQSRHATDDELLGWFGPNAKKHHTGLAVVLGTISGDLIARDFDIADAYSRWVEDYFEYATVLPTVQTGRGYHVYFQLSDSSPLQGRTIIKCDDGELRLSGGICLLPPSVHPSGVRYTWLIPPPDGPLHQIDPSEIGMVGSTEVRELSIVRTGKIPEGQRNDTLTRIAGSLRRPGLSEEAIAAALHKENLSRCEPPLPEHEVDIIAKSIAKYPPAHTSILVGEHRTDVGNAQRMIALHGENLRYVHSRKRWLVWSGDRWTVDESGQVVELAKKTITELYRAATEAEDGLRAELTKWAIKSESDHRLSAMIKLAASVPGVPVSPDDLDSDPWLLNCESGTIDLRTGAESPHRRSDLITRIVPTRYDLGAECPRFETFLARIFDGNTELIRFVQRSIGYALTGITSEHCLFIFYGTGRNGKTTLLELVAALLGEYAQQIPMETLMMTRGDRIPNDIARLKGARFVTAIENEEGRRLKESLVKHLTGGDRMTARFMRGEFFEFVPQCKVFIGVNHKPEIRGTDNAIWERLHLIPFGVTIPKPERDKQLPIRLREELSGFLRWSVGGCLLWQRDGLGVSREVLGATESYRTEMDVLGSFIAAKCTVKNDVRVRSTDLYRAYKSWCEEASERPVRQKDFVARMSERGFQNKKSSVMMWSGIGLLDEGQSSCE